MKEPGSPVEMAIKGRTTFGSNNIIATSVSLEERLGTC